MSEFGSIAKGAYSWLQKATREEAWLDYERGLLTAEEYYARFGDDHDGELGYALAELNQEYIAGIRASWV